MTFRSIIPLFLFLSLLKTQPSPVNSNNPGNYYYRIFFTDKGDVSISDYLPEDLLSTDAIERRARCGINSLSFSDLPVSSEYINSIKSKGLSFRCSSRWMNTALFSSSEAFNTSSIAGLSYVKKIELVKSPVKSGSPALDKFEKSGQPSDLDSFNPFNSVNGIPLMLSGYHGRGIKIAVLDVGFSYADKIGSLAALWSENRVIRTWDYVNNNSFVFDYHWHGTAVLSVLVGDPENSNPGPASGAEFMLLRTEDGSSEYPVEEDYWVAAAEYADSAGADIITSSLGYCTFDNPVFNHSFSEADGNTIFITRAADIAAAKGILVVNSAGNERQKSWQRIIFPSDGDSVFCIGATKQNLTIADFSSSGYSADRRVKPDVVAPGVDIPVQYQPSSWENVSGTSFSCPVISGMCAALMQAVPDATAAEIREAVVKSADRYNNPDSLYGYGLPDFTRALKTLQDEYVQEHEAFIAAGPNPFSDKIDVVFNETPEHLFIEIIDQSGKIIRKINYSVYASRLFTINSLDYLSQGVYFLRVRTSAGILTIKMIKLDQ